MWASQIQTDHATGLMARAPIDPTSKFYQALGVPSQIKYIHRCHSMSVCPLYTEHIGCDSAVGLSARISLPFGIFINNPCDSRTTTSEHVLLLAREHVPIHTILPVFDVSHCPTA